MTVKELYRFFLDALSALYEKQEASNITAMIFEHFAKIDRAALIINPGIILSEEAENSIRQSLAELKNNKPVQYIIGEAWFYKLKMKVSPAVLIPRPETEELVEAVIKYLSNTVDQKVIDIGTGSGCIPIAIKKNVASALITSVDVSAEALAIAKENASINNTEIDFRCLDFLDKDCWEKFGKFNVIVSNPPYIPENERQLLNKNVTAYEPHLALFVEKRMIFYEQIAAFGKSNLELNGRIFLEVHEDFADEVCSIFSSENYKSEIVKDIFGKNRMVFAIRYR